MTKVLLVCGALMTGVFLNVRDSHADEQAPTEQKAPAKDSRGIEQKPSTNVNTQRDDGVVDVGQDKQVQPMTCDVATCDNYCTTHGFCAGICETGAGCKCVNFPNC
jgi:hypothetical protein